MSKWTTIQPIKPDVFHYFSKRILSNHSLGYNSNACNTSSAPAMSNLIRSRVVKASVLINEACWIPLGLHWLAPRGLSSSQWPVAGEWHGKQYSTLDVQRYMEHSALIYGSCVSIQHEARSQGRPSQQVMIYCCMSSFMFKHLRVAFFIIDSTCLSLPSA